MIAFIAPFAAPSSECPPGGRELDVVRQHLSAGRVCRFGLAIAHTVRRTSGDVIAALVPCRGIRAPPRQRGGPLHGTTATACAAAIDFRAAVRAGHRRRSDDREVALTCRHFHITTVIRRFRAWPGLIDRPTRRVAMKGQWRVQAVEPEMRSPSERRRRPPPHAERRGQPARHEHQQVGDLTRCQQPPSRGDTPDPTARGAGILGGGEVLEAGRCRRLRDIARSPGRRSVRTRPQSTGSVAAVRHWTSDRHSSCPRRTQYRWRVVATRTDGLATGKGATGNDDRAIRWGAPRRSRRACSARARGAASPRWRRGRSCAASG